MIIIGSISCKNKQETQKSFDNITVTKLHGETIRIKDLFIGNPRQISILDSLLVLIDMYDNKCITVVDIKNRECINRFGSLGRGPEEFQGPHNFYFNKNYNSFGLMARNPNRHFIGTIDDLINDKRSKLSIKHKLRFKSPVIDMFALLNDKDKLICVGAFKEKGKYGIINTNGEVEYIFGDFYRNAEQKNVDNLNMSYFYQGVLRNHPNKNKVVYFSTVCDLIEVLNIDSINSKLESRYVTYLPKLVPNKAKPHRVSLDINANVGFLDVKCTDKYIYALYSGESYKNSPETCFSGNMVYVFDWSLNPVYKYKLNCNINMIEPTMDDKMLYGVGAINDDMEILRWKIEL